MANLHKGEVSFEAEGKTYTLCMSINAFCELDEALGMEDAIDKLMSSGKVSIKNRRMMFFIALRQRHPEIESERAAAELVTVSQMDRLLVDAIAAQNPPTAEKNAAHPTNGVGPSAATGPAS